MLESGPDTKTIEQKQEDNLHNNWEIRKDTAKKIGSKDDHDVFEYRDDFGRRIFYVVRKDIPVGYIACYVDLDGTSLQINSTFFSSYVRGRGLGTLAYLTTINQGNVLISDTDRSAGGEALWQKLCRIPSIDVTKNDEGQYIGRKTKIKIL